MKKLYLIYILLFSSFMVYGQNQNITDFESLKELKPHLKQFTNSNSGKSRSIITSKRNNINAPEIGVSNLIGGNGQNNGQFVFTDSNDNIYIIGEYRGKFSIEDQEIEDDAKFSYYLAKLNSNLELISLNKLADANTAQSNIKINHAEIFNGGVLISGFAVGDVNINDSNNNYSSPSSFFLNLNLDGTTKWLKIYNYSRSGSGHRTVIPVHTTSEAIYAAIGSFEIIKLDVNGDFLSQKGFNGYGQINDLIINGNDLIITGEFSNDLALDNILLYEENDYEASFIASLDSESLTTQWADENSVNDPQEFGDSFALNLLVDQNQNIYVSGTSRYSMAWGDHLVTGYFQNNFISKFRSDGTPDSTIFILNQRNNNSKPFLNEGEIYLSSNDFEEFNFGSDISSDNFLVLDTALSLNNSHMLDISNENFLRINSIHSSNDILYLTGVKDYNMSTFQLNKSDLTVINEMNSTTNNSGIFELLGLEGLNGNQFFAGNKFGGIDLYGENISDHSSALISKVDGNNNLVWVRKFYNGQVKFSFGNSLELHKNSEKLIVAGTAEENFSIGDQGYDITGDFICQLNTSGEVDWITAFPDEIDLESLTFDIEGNVYASGKMLDNLTFNNTNYTLHGREDFFVLKLNNLGEAEWFKNLGLESNLTYGSNITSSGNSIYLTGEFLISDGESNTAIIDDIEITMATDETGNNILVKISSEGNVAWAKSHGAGQYRFSYWATNIEGDNSDGLYMLGTYSINVKLDDITLESPYYYEHFIARYDADGNIIWVKPINTNSNIFGFNYNEIGIDENENVYIQGGFRDSLYFDSSNILVNETIQSNYIAKYTADGTFDWAQKISADYLFSRVMNVTSEDQIQVGGKLTGNYQFEDFSGNGFAGKSYIIGLCGTLGIPETPTGFKEVQQQDTSSYVSNISEYLNSQWEISPSEAGEIAFSENDSIAVVWSDTYLGTAMIRLKTSNNCYESDFSESIDVEVIERTVTNNRKLKEHNVSVFPNPTTGTINILINERTLINEIELYDLTGRLLIQYNNVNENNFNLNVSELEQSTYLLRIKSEKGAIVKKILKTSY